MKKGRFSVEQMVGILREADKSPVAQISKTHRVREQTIYTWRKRFSALEAVDRRRLRQLEQENGKLKKLAAERDLEIEVMKEVTQKNGERMRSPQAAALRLWARAVAAPGVCAAPSGAIGPWVR